MKLQSFLSSRQVAAVIFGLFGAGWLAVGCGNNGGVGDGVVDNSLPPGGSTNTAGKSGGKAGAMNASGGASSQSGSAGASAISGAAGISGVTGSAGKGGAAGAGGAGGAASVAGAAGKGAGGAASGGMSGGGRGGGGAMGNAGGGPTSCGNGTLEGGETCDSGSPTISGGGDSAGLGGNSGTAGGGDTGTTGAGGTASAQYGQLCSSTCYKVGTQACLDCENAGDCFESVNNCLGVDAPFDDAQQAACYSVLRCIQKNNCFDGTDTLGKCYCGSLATTACGSAPFFGAGSPDGVCVNEIKAGFPTLASNSAVLGGLVAVAFPSGAAMKRLSCQKGADNGACAGICGFTSGGPAFP